MAPEIHVLTISVVKQVSVFPASQLEYIDILFGNDYVVRLGASLRQIIEGYTIF